MRLSLRRFEPALRPDFDRVHSQACGAGWCRCVAWWVPRWDGFPDRSAEENRALRDALLADGEYDGYLLHADGAAACWCQCGPRDRLPKLVAQFELEADPEAWAVTCFLTVPAYRHRRLAARLPAFQVVRDDPVRPVLRLEL